MRSLLLLLASVSLPACATIRQPFFYSAEKDGKKLVLLGTIHVGVLANDLPGVVSDEMYSSKTAYFETDFRRFQAVLDAEGDKEKIRKAIGRSYFRRWVGRRRAAEPVLSERVPKELYEQLKQRLPQLPESTLEELNPEGALALVRERQYADISNFEAFRMYPGNSMDLWLHKWAVEKGVPTKRLDRNDHVCEREFDEAAIRSMQNIFQGMSGGKRIDRYRDLVEAYHEGDEAKVREVADKAAGELEGSCLIGERNREWMTKLMAAAVPGEKIFVAVGALHLLSEKYPSLLKLLADEGYTVKRFER